MISYSVFDDGTRRVLIDSGVIPPLLEALEKEQELTVLAAASVAVRSVANFFYQQTFSRKKIITTTQISIENLHLNNNSLILI